MPSELGRTWPESPYKGLGFYIEADAPLFAGRDKDIVRGAAALAEWKTRLLLLHGSTGCGKSSFLRAGLIPYLETGSAGIAFARTGPAESPALFIRSTQEPLAKLATAIYSFAARDVTISTPDGPQELNLRLALPTPNESDITAFLREYGNNPDVLLHIIEELGKLVPETLVLIIDQGEEVLTVDNTAKGEEWRTQFFEFLSEFTDSQIDVKILISLRTEYLGRFASQLRHGLRDPRIAEYFLDELNEAQIKEAVLRPTSTKTVGTLGAPSDYYRFSFSDGVVDSIIAQLGRAAGGKLTAVQIVCGELYELVSSRDKLRKVTFEDLDSIGGVEGSIERFLDKQLLYSAKAMNLSPTTCEEEIVRWKKALHTLAVLQPDGTVTTDLRPEQSLREKLAEESHLDFYYTISHLLNTRVLREANVVNAESGELIRCFGLGHDTLGLVLRNWRIRYDRNVGDTPLHTSEDRIDEEAISLDEEAISPETGTALCLSGGGYRAMVFHIGVLWRLYEAGLMPSIKRISSVSASSITAGFLGLKWSRLSFLPCRLQEDFVPEVVTPLRELAGTSIDVRAVWSGLLPGTHASDLLTTAYDQNLFQGATLQDLPDEPRFVIVATNLQSGVLWRFMKAYMRDYRVGEVRKPTIPLARVIAASSASPPILSPCEIRLRPDAFTPGTGLDLQREPFTTKVLLIDGSVYDNLALETAWKRYRTILVSDAGNRMLEEEEPKTDWGRQAIRVTGLIDNQIRGLRKRQLIDSFRTNLRNGAYWGIRTHIADFALADALPCPFERTIELSSIPTRLQRLDEDTQERLINWGYAVCDAAIRKFVDAQLPSGRFPYRIGV
jgi:NTE family protein